MHLKNRNTSNYEEGDGEYNLLQMYRGTISEAFERHKGESLEFISAKLGISCRGLYRWCDMFDMRYLIATNHEYRKSFVK